MASIRNFHILRQWILQVSRHLGVSFFLALTLIYSLDSFAQAPQSRQHIVFDLDWTLIYPTTQEKAELDPKDIIRFENHVYRLSPHTVEVLSQLHEEGYKISIFSGGSKARNEHIAQHILNLAQETGQKLEFFKVLNFSDLTPKVTASQTPVRFADKYAKDLTKISLDTSQVLLVDDINKFSLNSQTKSLLYLHPTYNDSPLPPSRSQNNRDQSPLADVTYDAPNDLEWHKERNKLAWVYDLIKTTQTQPKGLFLDIIQKNQKKPRCGYILFH